MKNEIIIYQLNNLSEKLEVRIKDNNIWLTQAQILSLFESSKANISEHIKHIFHTKELDKNTTVRKIRTVRKEGNRTVSRDLTHYNLDMIISIGYRVNSIRGTQFRIWANNVLKEYLLKGYAINNRMNRIEDSVYNLTRKISEIDLILKTNLPPNQDVFFDGQIFDAYTFVSDLIRTANKSIILIDNYLDDTVLTHFTKRKKSVNLILITKSVSKQFKLDIKKYNEQYPTVQVKEFKYTHDRFLIIDEKDVFHFGASLKDLGKKWFVFSKMDISSVKILDKLKKEKLI